MLDTVCSSMTKVCHLSGEIRWSHEKKTKYENTIGLDIGQSEIREVGQRRGPTFSEGLRISEIGLWMAQSKEDQFIKKGIVYANPWNDGTFNAYLENKYLIF